MTPTPTHRSTDRRSPLPRRQSVFVAVALLATSLPLAGCGAANDESAESGGPKATGVLEGAVVSGQTDARMASSGPTPTPKVVACSSNAGCNDDAMCVEGTCIVGDRFTSEGAIVGSSRGYSWDSDSCTASYPYAAYRPQGPGPFPVFVFLNGTLDKGQPANAWNHPLMHEAFLKPMAARGFYAVMAEYPRTNNVVGTKLVDHEIDPHYDNKARCLFEQSIDPKADTYRGLLSTLDRLPEVDTKLGIAVQGQSQGGIISVIAHDFNSNVAAVLGFGVGNFSDRGRCQGVSGNFHGIDEGRRTLPSSRLRIVNGASDTQFGENTDCASTGGRGPQARSQFNEIFGAQAAPCTNPESRFECLATNGSGWIVVEDRFVVDGVADHGYWVYANAPDRNWQFGEGPGGSGTWTRRAGQDWIQRTVYAR